eukprot:jgi/Bigna1/80242/fgenesh1_pg.69_\
MASEQQNPVLMRIMPKTRRTRDRLSRNSILLNNIFSQDTRSGRHEGLSCMRPHASRPSGARRLSVDERLLTDVFAPPSPPAPPVADDAEALDDGGYIDEELKGNAFLSSITPRLRRRLLVGGMLGLGGYVYLNLEDKATYQTLSREATTYYKAPGVKATDLILGVGRYPYIGDDVYVHFLGMWYYANDDREERGVIFVDTKKAAPREEFG